MNNDNIIIRLARPDEAEHVAKLIMTAMTEECCLWFCGEGHDISDLHKVMTELVKQEDSQYSFLNTLCAVDSHDNIVGILTSYDGGRLHELRQRFIEAAKMAWGIDHSNIPDETGPGELYLDSLAVEPSSRGKGIASKLIEASVDKARKMGLPFTGLLVDTSNPRAEALYTRLGFRVEGTNQWGGHPMRHMVKLTSNR